MHRVASTEAITATIDTVKASGVAALNVLSSPLLYGNRQLIMDRVAALRLPAVYRSLLPLVDPAERQPPHTPAARPEASKLRHIKGPQARVDCLGSFS
jgi:hypothetical protein